MDDIYNPNNNGTESSPAEQKPVMKPEQSFPTKSEGENPVQTGVQQPVTPQQPIRTQPAQPVRTQFTPQQRANTQPMHSTAPQGYKPVQQGYATRPQQPRQSQQPQSPVYYNPNGTQAPYAPVVPVPKKEKKRKKLGAGKVIFIILICISIISSTVALGLSYKLSKFTDNTLEELTTENNITIPDATDDIYGPGATPSVEDSPISYSEYSGSGSMTSEQIYSAVKDINVGVIVYQQNENIGEGSGIVVGEDETHTYTYILTAAHVIADKGIDVQIQFSDATEHDAQIIGIDTKTDVGVLRVAKTGYKAASFGNSDKLTVGQRVYAIGNPGGTEFFGSFTGGIIGAIDRPVPTNNTSYDLPCIQHDAAINPGNSGGALVNEYGQVIGLNSSKIASTEYEGMGFSVPINTVLDVYNQIVLYGYVKNRPMLGINYIPAAEDRSYSAVLRQHNLPHGSIVIATINETSDIANHNIKVEDFIIAVNGNELETTDVLLKTIENSKVGDTLTLTICRIKGNNVETFDVNVKLVEDKGNAVTPSVENKQSYDNILPKSNY